MGEAVLQCVRMCCHVLLCDYTLLCAATFDDVLLYVTNVSMCEDVLLCVRMCCHVLLCVRMCDYALLCGCYV
jgi:hypothetical protein